MEPQEQPFLERVTGGIMRSALNGAVMMGVYLPLQFLSIHLGLAALVGSPLVASALVVIAAVSIFGGIIASGILGNHHAAQSNGRDGQSREQEVDVQISAPALGRAPVPIIMPDTAPEMQESAPTRNWSERPDIQAQRGRSSLEKILADGASGQSHAEAILAEQQAAPSSPTIH